MERVLFWGFFLVPHCIYSWTWLYLSIHPGSKLTTLSNLIRLDANTTPLDPALFLLLRCCKNPYVAVHLFAINKSVQTRAMLIISDWLLLALQ